MKKLLILALMATLAIPVSAMAMKTMGHDGAAMGTMGHDGAAMEKDGKAMNKGSMGMEGVVMLQDEVVDGVKGAAHLMDDPKMGKMLMVMFTDAGSGAMLSEGRVAVKIEGPDAKVGEPLMMMPSQGMFGAGVKLDQKGTYNFTVGTKLADGQKRTFHFHFEG